MKKTVAQFLLAAALVGGTTFATADVALAAGSGWGARVVGGGWGSSDKDAFLNAWNDAKGKCESKSIQMQGYNVYPSGGQWSAWVVATCS